MFQAKMRKLVAEDVVNLAAAHALQQVVGESDGVAGASECIGHLPLAGRNHVDLLELHAETLGHTECCVAKFAGGERLRLHAHHFLKFYAGDEFDEQRCEDQKNSDAKISASERADSFHAQEDGQKRGAERVDSL